MGDFSRDPNTHAQDAIAKHYVGVRLQQGVPILDADWNELEDIRRYALHTFLQWFVGNGVPDGNDGFQVVPIDGVDNDFLIRGGDGTTEGAGRCLVEGLTVTNEDDLSFSDQSLVGDAGLADAWGVPPLDPISTPTADGPILVYLDVWEREVDAAEDSSHLVNPVIGVETCVRVRREWVVRVREGNDLPASGDADHTPGHRYYGLASIERRTGDASIQPSDVSDLRERQLLMPPATLVPDLFGTSTEVYRRGEGRPSIDMRTALNALLRGELPASAPELLASGAPDNETGSSIVEDADQNLWVFFVSTRNGNQDLFLRRYTHATRSWSDDEALTTDPGDDHDPIALMDTTGDIWLLWHTDRGAATQNIWMKRYRASSASWDSDEELISSTDLDLEHTLLEDPNTNIRVFWTSLRDAGQPTLWTRRYTRAADAWSADQQLVASGTADQEPTAAVDAAGTIFLAWQSSRDADDQIYWNRYDLSANPQGPEDRIAPSGEDQRDPYILIDSRDVVHAFWRGRVSGTWQIHHARFDRAADSWTVVAQFPLDAFNNFDPTPVEDTLGNLWLFWRATRAAGEVLLYRIFNVATDSWSPERAVTNVPADYRLGAAFSSTTGAVWVLWNETEGGVTQAYHRQFFPVV